MPTCWRCHKPAAKATARTRARVNRNVQRLLERFTHSRLHMATHPISESHPVIFIFIFTCIWESAHPRNTDLFKFGIRKYPPPESQERRREGRKRPVYLFEWHCLNWSLTLFTTLTFMQMWKHLYVMDRIQLTEMTENNLVNWIHHAVER